MSRLENGWSRRFFDSGSAVWVQSTRGWNLKEAEYWLELNEVKSSGQRDGEARGIEQRGFWKM